MKRLFSPGLEEEALISDADVHDWLIVVLRVEDALVVFSFHTDLWEREVVDTCCHNFAVGPLGGGIVNGLIVILEMTEHIQLLIVFTQLGNLREDIIACFHHGSDGMTAEVFAAA